MIKIRLQKDWQFGLGIAIFGVGHQYNEQWVFERPKRVQIKEGEMVEQPSLYIDPGDVDLFIAALKDAIREYEGSTPDFSQGELKATKYHLEDLRSILRKSEVLG